MPSARLRRASFQAGGTTIAPEAAVASTGGGPWLIIGGVVAAAALLVAIVVWSSTGQPTPAAVDGDDLDEALVAAAVPQQPEPPIELPVAPVRLDPLTVADRLESALATERLFAKITVHGTVVELRSEFCAQPRLREIVAKAGPELRTQGVTALYCVELHGARVFTQSL